MAKVVTYTPKGISEHLKITFDLQDEGATIDEKARCSVLVIADPDDADLTVLTKTITFNDPSSVLTAPEWTTLKGLLAKYINAAVAEVEG